MLLIPEQHFQLDQLLHSPLLEQEEFLVKVVKVVQMELLEPLVVLLYEHKLPLLLQTTALVLAVAVVAVTAKV
jgi:hypothetical protein